MRQCWATSQPRYLTQLPQSMPLKMDDPEGHFACYEVLQFCHPWQAIALDLQSYSTPMEQKRVA